MLGNDDDEDFDAYEWDYPENDDDVVQYDFDGSPLPPVDNDCCYDHLYEHESNYNFIPPYNSEYQYHRNYQPVNDPWRRTGWYDDYPYYVDEYDDSDDEEGSESEEDSDEEDSVNREEHHLVEGRVLGHGLYAHENYQAQHQDGSYRGYYLWDAERRNGGRHVHQGSYGMRRNHLQDIHYNNEAEYNLGHRSSSSRSAAGLDSIHDTRARPPSCPQGSSRRSRARQSTDGQGRVYGGTGRSHERHVENGNWHREYHLLRTGRTATYSEDFITDSAEIAEDWMSMNRGRVGGHGSRPWR